jgi:hypothetical protein
MQVLSESSQPDDRGQPAKYEPGAGVAVSVTCESAPNSPAHVPGQLIPAGVDVTVPAPLPVSRTSSFSPTANDPWMSKLLVATITQEPNPEQSPDQPVKAEPDAADGLIVTVARS